ncbi:MAG: hypothetical protein KAQ68_10970 [Clostridiales bacterium]|nr:hypothetical protein [Clostridiales bacterium]
MKNSTQCPKCESVDIMQINGLIGQTQTTLNLISISSSEGVAVTRYVCSDCGYSEEWIVGKNLKKLKKKYRK